MQKYENDIHILNLRIANQVFIWDEGSQDLEREIVNEGTFYIEVEENGCFSSDSIIINIIPNPRVFLGQNTTVCDDMLFVITAASNVGTLTWEDGSTDSSFMLTEPDEIKATISQDGCVGSDSIRVDFN